MMRTLDQQIVPTKKIIEKENRMLFLPIFSPSLKHNKT